MAKSNRTNGAHGAVLDRALETGLLQAETGAKDVEVELRLTDAERRMVMALSSTLGLSVRSVLNAALRFTLHVAEHQGVLPTKLKEFPKRVEGASATFLLNADTQARLKQADMLGQVAPCALAGVKLLHARLLKVKASR